MSHRFNGALRCVSVVPLASVTWFVTFKQYYRKLVKVQNHFRSLRHAAHLIDHTPSAAAAVADADDALKRSGRSKHLHNRPDAPMIASVCVLPI